MKLLNFNQSYKGVIAEFAKNALSFSLLIIVQQIIALPIISRFYEVEMFGKIVIAFGIANIISSMIGFSIGNARLLDNNFYNYKYILLLNISNIATIFISIIIYFIIFSFNLINGLLYAFISLLANIRYFFQSEYRLKDDHNNILKQNIYYFIGILLGLIIFVFVKNWLIVFFFAELMTFILTYVFYIGKSRFFRKFVDKNKLDLSNSFQLMFNNGFSYSLNQCDRFIIYLILGAQNVSLYYAVSISARVGGLILNPLSNYILGKISNKKGSVINSDNKKNIYLIIKLAFIIMVVFFIINLIITPVLIKILYPSFFNMINFLIIPICAEAAVIGGISILKPITMKYKGVKHYNKLFLIYGGILILLSIFSCINFGLMGVAMAKFISSLILFFALLMGLKKISKFIGSQF